jgi:hypothetical protein
MVTIRRGAPPHLPTRQAVLARSQRLVVLVYTLGNVDEAEFAKKLQ